MSLHSGPNTNCTAPTQLWNFAENCSPTAGMGVDTESRRLIPTNQDGILGLQVPSICLYVGPVHGMIRSSTAILAKSHNGPSRAVLRLYSQKQLHRSLVHGSSKLLQVIYVMPGSRASYDRFQLPLRMSLWFLYENSKERCHARVKDIARQWSQWMLVSSISSWPLFRKPIRMRVSMTRSWRFPVWVWHRSCGRLSEFH